MTIIELAAALIAVAFVILVAYLVPMLIQLRKTVAESACLVAQLNKDLPALIADMRIATEVVNDLAEQTRGAVEHAAGFLHAVGEVGDAVHQVHETVRGKSGALLMRLAGMVAGIKAASSTIFRDRDDVHGREESNGH
jgi:uncharacterized protein YoxC